MVFSPSVWAQGKLLRPLVKPTVPKVAQRVVAKKLSLPRLPAPEAAYWKRVQRIGDFSSAEISLDFYFSLNPAHAPSVKLLERNKVLQEKLVENYLNREFYLSQKSSIHVLDAVTEKIKYTEFIPPSAQVIMLGEVHEKDWIINEVEEAVIQYQKAYPDRNVYYASEFVDATPGEVYLLRTKEDVERLVRKRPYYRGITSRMIGRGINVVGLENPEISSVVVKRGYRDVYSDDTDVAWNIISPAGIEMRNRYWEQSIRLILCKDPNAVVFVHAGIGHTNYNQPAALPGMLKDFQLYTVEFTDPGSEELNDLLETHADIVPVSSRARALAAENPGKPVRILRQFPSKKMAESVGCDFNVRLMRFRGR